MFRAVFHYCGALWPFFIDFFSVVVGDPGIEPGVRLREGVTVPCHTLRPVAHFELRQMPWFGHEYDLENRASTRKLSEIG